jgi:hypothetical protein
LMLVAAAPDRLASGTVLNLCGGRCAGCWNVSPFIVANPCFASPCSAIAHQIKTLV